jgi:hypothetical protein
MQNDGMVAGEGAIRCSFAVVDITCPEIRSAHNGRGSGGHQEHFDVAAFGSGDNALSPRS